MHSLSSYLPVGSILNIRRTMFVLLACIGLAIVSYVLVSWSSGLRTPSSAIPLPFGQESSSLRGQLLSLGTVGGRHIVDMTFEDGKVSEAFGVNDLTFLLTPSDPATFSAGAPLSSGFAPGTRFYGYKYKSADASQEIEMQRLKNNPPLDADGKPTAYTYSQLFPGTFFASDLHRNDQASFANTFHGIHDDVIFKPVSEVMLEPNSRYLIIAEADPANPTPPPVSIAVRSLTWCGDGIVQSGEQCDDGNADDTDGCLRSCQKPACSDGVDNNGDGLIDAADPYCHSDLNAANAGTYLPTFNREGRPAADLGIQLAGPTTSLAGNTDVFTITVSNMSSAPVRDVVARVPATNYGYGVDPRVAAGCTYDGPSSSYVCSTSLLAAGATKTFTVGFYSPANIGSCVDKQFVTTATVSSTKNDDPVSDNNTASVTTQVPCQKADLSVTQEIVAGATDLKLGGTITYAVTVRNNGPQIAKSVVVTMKKPDLPAVSAGVYRKPVYVATASDARCKSPYTESDVVCQGFDIPVDASETFQLSFTVPTDVACYATDKTTPASFSTTVSAKSSLPDPVVDNSQAATPVSLACAQCLDHIDNDGNGLMDSAEPFCHSDFDAANAATYLPQQNDEGVNLHADISVTQATFDGALSVKPGGRFTYVYTIHNAGPQIAKDVRLNSTMQYAGYSKAVVKSAWISSNMIPLSTSPFSQCKYSRSCQGFTIPVGGSVTVQMTFDFNGVVADARTIMKNEVTVQSAATDPVPSNNVASPLFTWVDPTSWNSSLTVEQNKQALGSQLFISLFDTGSTPNGVLGTLELAPATIQTIRAAMNSEMQHPHDPPSYDLNYDGAITQADIDLFETLVQGYVIPACPVSPMVYTMKMDNIALPYTAGIYLDKNCQALTNTNDPYHATLQSWTYADLNLTAPMSETYNQYLQCGVCSSVTSRMITYPNSTSHWIDRNLPSQLYFLSPSTCEFTFNGCQKVLY